MNNIANNVNNVTVVLFVLLAVISTISGSNSVVIPIVNYDTNCFNQEYLLKTDLGLNEDEIFNEILNNQQG